MVELNFNEEQDSMPQRVLSWLFRDADDFGLTAAEWAQFFCATVFYTPKQFYTEFFNALSKKITETFEDPELSDEKKDLILYNALSYLAFANPEEDQSLNIKGMDYSIERIQLTSKWISAPYYAYGLKAKNDDQVPSYLIFQGTTTPADNGFLAGLAADTTPWGAIGTELYRRGQKELQDWIEQESQRTHQRVICTGQSLGGAMSLHAHIHQPKLVDFYIINPPTLTKREERIYYENITKDIKSADDEARTMKIVTHVNDPVWALGDGFLPPATEVFHHGNEKEYGLLAHTKAPLCHPDSAEPLFLPYHYLEAKPNCIWDISKSFLFITVILMHLVVVPIRLVALLIISLTAPLFKKATQELPSKEDCINSKYGSMDDRKDVNINPPQSSRFSLFNDESEQSGDYKIIIDAPTP